MTWKTTGVSSEALDELRKQKAALTAEVFKLLGDYYLAVEGPMGADQRKEADSALKDA